VKGTFSRKSRRGVQVKLDSGSTVWVEPRVPVLSSLWKARCRSEVDHIDVLPYQDSGARKRARMQNRRRGKPERVPQQQVAAPGRINIF